MVRNRQPIKKMLEKKIESYGRDYCRISFSAVLKCSCNKSATNEASGFCRSCFGTGYLAAIKKERGIFDTERERNRSDESSFGSVSGLDIKIYSLNDIQEGDIVLISDDGFEPSDIFEVGTVYKERYFNGEVECIIATIRDYRVLFSRVKSLEVSKVGKRWIPLCKNTLKIY